MNLADQWRKLAASSASPLRHCGNFGCDVQSNNSRFFPAMQWHRPTVAACRHHGHRDDAGDTQVRQTVSISDGIYAIANLSVGRYS